VIGSNSSGAVPPREQPAARAISTIRPLRDKRTARDVELERVVGGGRGMSRTADVEVSPILARPVGNQNTSGRLLDCSRLVALGEIAGGQGFMQARRKRAGSRYPVSSRTSSTPRCTSAIWTV
jgi:hypothetical protein